MSRGFEVSQSWSRERRAFFLFREYSESSQENETEIDGKGEKEGEENQRASPEESIIRICRDRETC